MLYEDGVMARVAERADIVLLDKHHGPKGSEKDIQDKSKGDSFSKGFAVLQTTWFVSQCIARGVAGLVITELELATFAFAVLNGILYFLWWNKPLNVSSPTPIYLHRHSTSCSNVDDRSSLTTRERSLERYSSTSLQHSSAFGRFCTYSCGLLKAPFFALRYVWQTTLFHREINQWPTLPTRSGRRQNQEVPPLSVPTFYAPSTRREDRARLIGLGIGVLFGGIHCIAWSFEFPSIAEKWIWRISAVNVTVIPIVMASLYVVILIGFVRVGSIFITIIRYMYSTCMVVYSISRSALLILPVIALRSLSPASLVEFKWSAFIPHI